MHVYIVHSYSKSKKSFAKVKHLPHIIILAAFYRTIIFYGHIHVLAAKLVSNSAMATEKLCSLVTISGGSRTGMIYIKCAK